MQSAKSGDKPNHQRDSPNAVVLVNNHSQTIPLETIAPSTKHAHPKEKVVPTTNNWLAIREKLTADSAPQEFIDLFQCYYSQLAAGHTGLMPESEIEPVVSLPDADTLRDTAADGESALKQTVMIKLNGGLGTGMGLEEPKSLLPVRGKRTFLEIIARQADHDGIPLILMNSDATEQRSREFLAGIGFTSRDDIPLSFCQHRAPKITEDFGPANWKDAKFEWCPPGHGDIFIALRTSGVLDRVLQAGYRYAFVSNADNLGAVIEPSILGYMIREESAFLMEVADRTEMDRKGGHLARKKSDGGLTLRESAQCPDEDVETFQDETRHAYFNTNNLWLDLHQLKDWINGDVQQMALPLIRNAKTVDPRDAKSPRVFQLETAMGSAISVIPNAAAIRVSRDRFAPVKSTNELLLVRSDAYTETESHRIVLRPDAQRTTVKLDGVYKFIDGFDARFPHGPPSMSECSSLTVNGDFTFGKNVTLKGDVTLNPPPVSIEDGATLKGESSGGTEP